MEDDATSKLSFSRKSAKGIVVVKNAFDTDSAPVLSESDGNDLQHAEGLLLDTVFGVPFFIEARVVHRKTRRANTWSGRAMPLVAHAVGVAEDNWVHLVETPPGQLSSLSCTEP